ncbi:D-tyrosyl-tRNA(Tyr) deacylase [Streptomyces lavendulae subsp. lavendulae]|uniref:D-aminoacyl-tRNA deacylase n=1 Tax=Streptomyces lavendulae subsp. lavendulae TaxID=58340 RepID=A0A2K8PF91_STRLA|nr:D-tyrosyl-tRNA(Tyr) deacylase [Streptomyces lavendulae subsp. lavendulae]QUQ55240.1 D-aminoacyl-tRNA deacylase [Streptomyces lavendulae subsp. lavendulae]GLV81816.1 D-aminoacyl-tRNA deacylase [Streptomyces lavendulae subsp. lavendulae]GLX40009.1 D-aminoacyl-tRNA deacylase [Streptomyces roseochromogenus]
MVQRVDGASVVVAGETVGEIVGEGLCVLVGVTHDDTPEKAALLARKLWSVRILEAEKSCSDIGAPLLVISQFTLYGDARKGRRPTWNAAAPGPVAEPLVDEVVAQLRALGATVETGRFGADMRVSLTNHGPFTIVIDI